MSKDALQDALSVSNQRLFELRPNRRGLMPRNPLPQLVHIRTAVYPSTRCGACDRQINRSDQASEADFPLSTPERLVLIRARVCVRPVYLILPYDTHPAYGAWRWPSSAILAIGMRPAPPGPVGAGHCGAPHPHPLARVALPHPRPLGHLRAEARGRFHLPTRWTALRAAGL